MYLRSVAHAERAASSSHALLNGPYGKLSIQGNKFEFYTFQAAATSAPLNQPNQRIHLAGVNNSGQRRLYLDGARVLPRATTQARSIPI